VGAITVINADNSSDTADLIIGDGGATATNAHVVVVINSTITGTSTGGASTVAGNNLDIRVDGVHGNVTSNTITFEGNVDAGTDLALEGDANGINTINLGDGTTGMTYSGTIAFGTVGTAGVDILTLAAGGTTLAGTLDLAQNGGTTLVINLKEASEISGAISDTADATAVTINVDGNATISGAVDAGHTAATNIAVDDAKTLTLSGTGTIVGANIDIDLTGNTGTLKNTGAKAMTASIDGVGDNAGILDIDADLTLTGAVGTTSSLTVKSVLIADGATLSVSASSDATNTTLGSTATGTTGTLATGGNITWTGLVDGFDDNVGTIDINHTTTLASNIGATKDLALVDIAGVTVTVSGHVSANVLNFSADGTANFADAKILTGKVTATTDGHGTLTNATGTSGLTLVSGDIGTTTKRLKALTLTSANSVTQVLGGNVHVDAIGLTGGGTGTKWSVGGDISGNTMVLTTEGVVEMAAGKNITTVVTASANDKAGISCLGDCTITGTVGAIDGDALRVLTTNTTGTVTMEGNLATTLTTVQAGGTLAITTARTFETSFANAGTLDLGATLTMDASAVASDISNATSAILKLAPNDQYTGGEVLVAAGDAINAGAVGTITPDASFTSGTLTIIDDNGGGGTAAATNKWNVTASSLADYTLSVASSDLILTATAKTSAAIGAALGVSDDAGEAVGTAAAMFANVAAANASQRTTFNTIMAAGGAPAAELAEQVQGSPDGLSATSGAAVASAGATVVSVGSSRMAALRTGQAFASASGSGFSAGSGSTSNNMWMKPFASFGKQTERKGVAGYDADTYGIAIGGDTRLNAHSIVGLSFSYADTDVDGRGAGRSKSDIGSYQLTAYGDYTAKDYYIEALVGYAYNDIDTSRIITATSETAKGDAESNQFMLSVTGGMPMKAGHNSYFTPSVGLNLTHVDNKSYTETGAGALNLAIKPEDITIAKVVLGGRYHATVKSADGIFTPELRARLLYDMAGDDGSSSNTFTGGGAAFNNNGLDVVEFSTNIGAGMAYTPSFDQGMTLSMNYDWETKTNYNGHSANFTLNYAF
jgi:outer membrane autotransporter protein